MECLGAWETFLHDDSLPPLVHAALAHSQFEAIHPFLDGNGRVSRLLITLLLVTKGVLPSPLLYLSAFFDATREEYYAHLLAVTQRGQWEEWLGYFFTESGTAGRRRTGPHPPHRRPARTLARAIRQGPVTASRTGRRSVRRESVLDRQEDGRAT